MMMKMPLGKTIPHNSAEAITSKLQSLDSFSSPPPPKPTRINNSTTNSLDSLSDKNSLKRVMTASSTLKTNDDITDDKFRVNKNHFSPITANQRSPSMNNSKSDFKYSSNNVIIFIILKKIRLAS